MSAQQNLPDFGRVQITPEMIERGARALHFSHGSIPFCDAEHEKDEFYYGDIKPDCPNMRGFRWNAERVLRAALGSPVVLKPQSGTFVDLGGKAVRVQ